MTAPWRTSDRASTSGLGPVRALAADLRDLGVDLEAGSCTSTTLAMFRRDLLRAVPSALGATIRLVPDRLVDLPVEVHLVDRTLVPGAIVAGLLLSSRVREGVTSSVLLYAGRPSAFLGLAADLRTVTDSEGHEVDEHPPLPHEAISPSVVGLENFSVVNRALGVLLSRGYGLVEARAELDRRAALERTDLPRAAQHLLSVYR